MIWDNNIGDNENCEEYFDDYDPLSESELLRNLILKECMARIQPSKNGLYPHEILIIYFAPNFSTDAKYFQGFWQGYHVTNSKIKSIINLLLEKGFIEKGDIASSLNLYTNAELKNELKLNNLKQTGNKTELISRLVNNIDLDILSRHFPKRNYKITPKGEKELSENDYVLWYHKQSSNRNIMHFDNYFLHLEDNDLSVLRNFTEDRTDETLTREEQKCINKIVDNEFSEISIWKMNEFYNSNPSHDWQSELKNFYLSKLDDEVKSFNEGEITSYDCSRLYNLYSKIEDYDTAVNYLFLSFFMYLFEYNRDVHESYPRMGGVYEKYNPQGQIILDDEELKSEYLNVYNAFFVNFEELTPDKERKLNNKMNNIQIEIFKKYYPNWNRDEFDLGIMISEDPYKNQNLLMNITPKKLRSEDLDLTQKYLHTRIKEDIYKIFYQGSVEYLVKMMQEKKVDIDLIKINEIIKKIPTKHFPVLNELYTFVKAKIANNEKLSERIYKDIEAKIFFQTQRFTYNGVKYTIDLEEK